MSHLDPNALISRGFKVGSIVRLKMKNFLTYDECEFFTGPRLNLVIGPNGTGKSALTHAICLACCGSTGDVGRSTDLSKFVKHGAEGKESYAEVDILTEERSLATIRRVINSENKGSKWFLNGKLAKQADVKALVTRLSIDVDNLCSFMPQDKVGSFSRFTPKEILSNTLRSIQNPADQFSLSDEQHALSEIQDAKEDYRRKRDAKQASLDAGKRDLDSMKGEIDRMQRREEKQKLYDDYEVRLLAVEIGELLQREQDKQDVVDQKAAMLQEETRKIAPLEVRERELKMQQTARDKAAETAQTMQRKIDDSLRAKKEAVDQCGVDLDSVANKLVSHSRARAGKEQQLQQAVQELETVQKKWEAAMAPIPQLDARSAELRNELNVLNDRRERIDDQMRIVNQLCGQLREEVIATKKEGSGLQDARQIYRANLARATDPHSRQVLTAMDWLDNNQERLRQNGQLRSEVFGPVARYCTVADPACAVMLEKAIPNHRFMGFVVDNDADAGFLKHEFRTNQGLQIDIITMKRVILDVPRIYPDKMIRELHLTGYLADQLVCPDIIRALFYSFHQLHKVLWGRGADHISTEQQVRLCQVDRGGFKLYIHETAGGGSSHNSRGGQQQMSIIEYRGKFGRDPRAPPSTSSVGVTGRGIVQGSGGGEDVEEQRAALQRKLAETGSNLKKAESDLSLQHELLKQVQVELLENRNEQTAIRALKNEPATLKTKVDQVKRKVAGFRQELATDAQEERAELVADYEQAIQKLFDTAQDTVKLVQRSTAQKVERMVTARLKDELLEALREVSSQLDEAKKGVKVLTKELAVAEKERDDVRRNMQTKEKELNERMEATGLTREAYANQIYKPIVERCPENTVGAVQARMEQLMDEINRIADNPLLQKRFEDVTRDVLRFEAELARAAEEFTNAEESLTERSQRWLTMVRRTTEKLNTKFSAYMSDLQLGGEVKLREIGKFDDYEMQLRVKFRENSEMSELDGNKHSGGERAVSTVMFLMALQDMTTSPFRVVDEINQGMDESNERLVFDRVVKSCCGDASKPQYFLVTPKLLQGLGAMRNDDVTVLLVWNGPGTVKKWTFSDILRNLSQGHSQADSAVFSQSLPLGGPAGSASSFSSAQAPASKMRRGATAPAPAVVKEEKIKVSPATAKRQRAAADSDQEQEQDEEDSEAEAAQKKQKQQKAKPVVIKKQKD